LFDPINELKGLEFKKKLNLLYAGLTAEECADQRDSVLGKQLRKLYKEFFFSGLSIKFVLNSFR
jgi:hypothetical protein